MKEEQLDKRFLQSYLFTEKYGGFMVSTAYRQSSAAVNNPPWYYETFAWKWNPITRERGSWIADHSGARYEDAAVQQHNDVVEQLRKTGEFKEPSDE